MPSPTDHAMSAIGRGLVAGLAGTAAMTVSSTIEARLTGRGSSSTPADAVEKVVHVEPTDEAGETRLGTGAHWGYGTVWGLGRGVLDLLGVRGPLATLIHFGAVLGAEQAMLPALGIGKPTPAYGAEATLTDTLHHAVYAVATGLVYDALSD